LVLEGGQSWPQPPFRRRQSRLKSRLQADLPAPQNQTDALPEMCKTAYGRSTRGQRHNGGRGLRYGGQRGAAGDLSGDQIRRNPHVELVGANLARREARE